MNILYKPSMSVSLLGTIMLISSLISLGCKSKNAQNATAQPPPPSVVVASVNQKTVPIYSEFVGQTRADDTVELRARVEGILQKVYFKEGSHIKKGQLLFTIDKRTFQAALQSAKEGKLVRIG